MKLKQIILTNWTIIIILIVAAILRFWRLEALTTFGGDQGYDFLVVKRMLVDGKWTLLGPKLGPYSSIGNIYLGSAYYYLIAPSLLIFNFDPIGPSILMVFLSIATIIIIYQISLKFFSRNVAILASALYAFNAALIEQSRVALNPFPIPFFASVSLLASLKIITGKKQSVIWPAVLGFALGILFQLHYLTAALTFAVVLAFIFFKRLKQIAYLTVTFSIAISGQILFELRHQFFITNQILRRIFHGQDLSSPELLRYQIIDSLQILSKTFLTTNHIIFSSILTVGILLFIYKARTKEHRKVLSLMILTIIFAIFFASMYSASVQLHYFAAIYPSVVLLISIAILQILGIFKNFFVKTLLIIFLAQLFTINFLNLNLKRSNGYTMPEGWNMPGIKKASEIIAGDISSGKTFNIAATLDGDTRARPYRYLLEVKNKIPLDVEHYPDSDVIYLVSRDEEETIKKYVVWEVASFAPFEINKLSDVQNGIKVYKLARTKVR